MRHGSLCTGIGGFDLAAEWCGWENIFQVEKDEKCKKVLMKNFHSKEVDAFDFYPDEIRTMLYSDIYKFNGKEYYNKVDIISAGFPCQPFSVAGKQKGKKDGRYLWPEVLRVITEARPRWFIGENVSGLFKMELDTVCNDLETQGYTVEAILLPACSTDAPHARERVWIIAHTDRHAQSEFSEYGKAGKRIYSDSNSIGCEASRGFHRSMRPKTIGARETSGIISNGTLTPAYANGIRSQCPGNFRELGGQRFGLYDSSDIAADTHCIEWDERFTGSSEQAQASIISPSGSNGIYTFPDTDARLSECKVQPRRQQSSASSTRTYFNNFDHFPTQSPVCRGNDGLSGRVDRIKQLGNSVVPQLVYEIFQCIDIIDKGEHNEL